ncbi:HNH endonuclease [Streptomyces sp. SID11385]|uniref:HNH endonuclease n=1 Tax=Streptomyces sp. SID11385 TaxID=2706031 RepID=UPI0013CBEF00|nr:HNH endonuclease [Streptomyces sp. SID11385]NEA42898.1 HNH endonuclease [Streptomyces sp. SID11385]
MNSSTARLAARPRLTPDSRRMISEHLAERDGRHCHYCRRPFGPGLAGATLDHYVPVTLWATNKPRNLVLACRACNEHKADRLPPALALLLTAAQPPIGEAFTVFTTPFTPAALLPLLLALGRLSNAIRTPAVHDELRVFTAPDRLFTTDTRPALRSVPDLRDYPSHTPVTAGPQSAPAPLAQSGAPGSREAA